MPNTLTIDIPEAWTLKTAATLGHIDYNALEDTPVNLTGTPEALQILLTLPTIETLKLSQHVTNLKVPENIFQNALKEKGTEEWRTALLNNQCPAHLLEQNYYDTTLRDEDSTFAQTIIPANTNGQHITLKELEKLNPHKNNPTPHTTNLIHTAAAHGNEKTLLKTWEYYLLSGTLQRHYPQVPFNLTQNTQCPEKILEDLTQGPDTLIARHAIRNENYPLEKAIKKLTDNNAYETLIMRQDCPEQYVLQASKSSNQGIKLKAYENPKILAHITQKQTLDYYSLLGLALNPADPEGKTFKKFSNYTHNDERINRILTLKNFKIHQALKNEKPSALVPHLAETLNIDYHTIYSTLIEYPELTPTEHKTLLQSI